MAGTTMCDGVSPASWTMYSPKSVSTGSMPRRASRSFRWISSDAMLLLLTTERAPRCSAMRPKLAAMWSPPRLPGGKDFRQVQGTDGRPAAREATADLHQAAGVAGHHGVHARPLDRVYFFVQHRHRDLRVFHRKRAPEAA